MCRWEYIQYCKTLYGILPFVKEFVILIKILKLKKQKFSQCMLCINRDPDLVSYIVNTTLCNVTGQSS